jgi:hypothetical protein
MSQLSFLVVTTVVLVRPRRSHARGKPASPHKIYPYIIRSHIFCHQQKQSKERPMWTYLYHSLVYWTLKTAWKTIIFLAPESIVEAALIKKFAEWGVRVVIDDGKSKPPSEKKQSSIIPPVSSSSPSCQVTMTVYNRRFFKRFAVDHMLAHGEAYMNGWFDSTDLATQIKCITTNGIRSTGLDASLFRYLWVLRNQMKTARSLQTKGAQSLEVIDVHYNLGNDLYGLMLDERYVEEACKSPKTQQPLLTTTRL